MQAGPTLEPEPACLQQQTKRKGMQRNRYRPQDKRAIAAYSSQLAGLLRG